MDRLKKALAKLPKEHKANFDFIISRLLSGDFTGLQIAKIRGQKDVYRVKRGRLRVVFRIASREILIISVSLRSEKTYRDF